MNRYILCPSELTGLAIFKHLLVASKLTVSRAYITGGYAYA